MATQYGKELRKIRIDKSLVLGDMASALDFSVSYLSAIENGKRDIPKDLTSRLVNLYALSEEQKNTLEKAAIEVQKVVNINLEKVIENPEYAETAMMVARNFSKMRPDQIQSIKKLFETVKEEVPHGRT